MQDQPILILLAGSPAEADSLRAIAKALSPAGHIDQPFSAGLHLLAWAREEGLESCPLCSSDVGSAHLSVCHDHYLNVSSDSPPFPYHGDAAGLLADTSRIRIANLRALPPDLPAGWVLLRASAPPPATPAARAPTQMGLYILRELGYTDSQILGMPLEECTRLIEQGIPANNPPNVLPFP